jgi:hypothetical protein
MAMLNALLDVRSNLCYTEGNAEPDPNLDGNGGGAFHRSCRRCRAIVHPGQRAKSEGLSTPLLCQYDVLCDVAKEYRSLVGATR